MLAFFSFLSSLGLGSAAGLNAFLPILTIGVLARIGLIQLNAPFDIISHPLVLLIVAALAVVDFIGDKVPMVDNGLHAIGLVLSPIAGAILALAATGDAASVHPIVLGGAGLVAALGVHGARSAIRPIIAAATGGTGNPVISVVEDIGALIMSVLAVLVPILAAIVALIAGVLTFRFFAGAGKVWQNGASDHTD
jgi:hypothetical protein